MIKIANNTQQFDLINQKIKQVENNENSVFSEITKHCREEKYAFGIGNEGDLIRNYLISFGLDFVTNEWLNENVVSELPIDWTWYRMDRPIRIIMTTDFVTNILLLQNDLAKVIEQKLIDNVREGLEGDFIVKSKEQTLAYFYTIDEEDAPIITPYIMSGDIVVEQLNS